MEVQYNVLTKIVIGVFLILLVVTVVNHVISGYSAYESINPNVSLSNITFTTVENEKDQYLANLESFTNNNATVITTVKEIGWGILKSLKSAPSVYKEVFNRLATNESSGYITADVTIWFYYIILIMFVFALIFIVLQIFI